MDSTKFWLLIVLLGVGTFAIRYSFILLSDTAGTPEFLRRALRYIPCSVMPAMFLPAVALYGTAQAQGANPEQIMRIAAAFVASAVGWKTRNMLATIGAGLASLWILRAIFG